MTIEPDSLRLPSRLFRKGNFYLPLKRNSVSQTEIELMFPVSCLTDPGVQRFVFSEYQESGYEIRERQILCRLIGPNSVFIDVGAHYGLFSLVLAGSIPDLLCIAVEPEPSNFSILSDNIAHNGLGDSVLAVELALSNKCGVGKLHLNSSMGHHLAQCSEASASDINVQIVTLDELLSQYISLDVGNRDFWIKIDTEGRERNVLDGAIGLFEASLIQGVLWEFRVGHLENPETSEILAFLKSFNFDSLQVSQNNILSVRGADFWKNFDFTKSN